MKRKHLIAVLLGLVAMSIFAADASAFYDPGLGCWMQRDPGAGGAMRGGGGEVAVGGRSIRREPTGQYAGGMNLYQYAGSSPTGYTDPFGLRKGPGVVKQTSGPDGDGEFSKWSLFRTNLLRRTHVVTDATGQRHKLGHTWIAMGPNGGDPSYGFYPKNYQDAWVTIIPGVTITSIIHTDQNDVARDPLNGSDNARNQIQPDWTWDTEVPDKDDGTILQAGRDASQKIKCSCASDDQIRDCVKSVAQEWAQKGWGVRQHCQDFVVDVLAKCCMKATNRQKG